MLTHWGPIFHICISKLAIIVSDNGFSPDWRQGIIWTNAGILSIAPLGTTFSEILIDIYISSFAKMHLKISSGNWQPFCLGLNMLTFHMTNWGSCRWGCTPKEWVRWGQADCQIAIQDQSVRINVTNKVDILFAISIIIQDFVWTTDIDRHKVIRVLMNKGYYFVVFVDGTSELVLTHEMLAFCRYHFNLFLINWNFSLYLRVQLRCQHWFR